MFVKKNNMNESMTQLKGRQRAFERDRSEPSGDSNSEVVISGVVLHQGDCLHPQMAGICLLLLCLKKSDWFNNVDLGCEFLILRFRKKSKNIQCKDNGRGNYTPFRFLRSEQASSRILLVQVQIQRTETSKYEARERKKVEGKKRNCWDSGCWESSSNLGTFPGQTFSTTAI